jgi:tRNA uridine 5-carbamoylmethylation protein Kti12
MTRPLIILTGPPGAGKSTYADTMKCAVYDQNLHNKAQWRDHRDGTLAILVTSAPDRSAKTYWLREAVKFGFSPKLVVLDPGIATTTQQLMRREMESPEGQRRRLSRTVQRWYREYSPHKAESRVLE